jgi:hypothetical protein
MIYCFPVNSSVGKKVLDVCKVGEYCKVTLVADHWSSSANVNIGDYGGLTGTLVHKVIRINKITRNDWLNDPEMPK